MKKSGIIFLVVFVVSCFVHDSASAQSSAGYLRLGGLGQVITPKTRSASNMGTIFIDTTWRKANITLYNSDQLIPDIFTKYELRSNEIELRVDGQIKVLDPKLVKAMTYYGQYDQPHQFTNGKEFTVNGAPLRSLVEIIYQGKISVYKEYSYYVQPSNRSEVLATGTRDETIGNENHLFYSADGKTLQRLPKRKKLLELFGDKMPAMQKFIKDNNLDTSNEVSIKKIFEHYNGL